VDRIHSEITGLPRTVQGAVPCASSCLATFKNDPRSLISQLENQRLRVIGSARRGAALEITQFIDINKFVYLAK